MQPRKLFALFFATILLCNTYGIVFTGAMQRGLALGADNTYTVTNIIFFNATGILAEGTQLHCLKVSQTVPINEKDTIPLKDDEGETVTDNFAPMVNIDTRKFINNAYERIQAPYSTITLGNLTYAVAETLYDPLISAGTFLNGTPLVLNASTFFGVGFPQTTPGFSLIEKSLVFESPLNYVEAYCDAEGWTLVEIINSTYEREHNFNTMNLFRSQLVKQDTVIFVENETETMARSGQISTMALGTATLILIICIIVALTATAILVPWLLAREARLGLTSSTDANKDVFDDTLDVLEDFLDTMTANKAFERDRAYWLLANSTITFEQYLFLLQEIDASYNPLINTALTDISAITTAFFNATSDLYGKFAAALADITSWSSWIDLLIMLIIIIVVIYFVYVLISKFRGASAGAQTINLARL